MKAFQCNQSNEFCWSTFYEERAFLSDAEQSRAEQSKEESDTGDNVCHPMRICASGVGARATLKFPESERSPHVNFSLSCARMWCSPYSPGGSSASCARRLACSRRRRRASGARRAPTCTPTYSLRRPASACHIRCGPSITRNTSTSTRLVIYTVCTETRIR